MCDTERISILVKFKKSEATILTTKHVVKESYTFKELLSE